MVTCCFRSSTDYYPTHCHYTTSSTTHWARPAGHPDLDEVGFASLIPIKETRFQVMAKSSCWGCCVTCAALQVQIQDTARAKPLAGITQPARTAPLCSTSVPSRKASLAQSCRGMPRCCAGKAVTPSLHGAVWACKLPRHLSYINVSISVPSIRTSSTHMLFTLWLNRQIGYMT